MYSTGNRECALRGKNSAGMDDVEILEKAIALVKENAPEHRELIGRLAAAARLLAGLQPLHGLDEGLMIYRDRPEAIARTVLDGLHHSR